MKKPRTHLEDELAWQCRVMGLPTPKRQYRFNPERKWKCDFAWPELRLIVEVEGGIWMADGKGGHNRGSRMIEDMNRQNWALLNGWLMLRFADKHIKSLEAVKAIDFVVNVRSQQPRILHVGG